jgi:hypothetical protein
VVGMEPRVFHILDKNSTIAIFFLRVENKVRCRYLTHIYIYIYIFFFLWYWGLNSGPAPWSTPPALFCDGLFFFFFWDRV